MLSLHAYMEDNTPVVEQKQNPKGNRMIKFIKNAVVDVERQFDRSHKTMAAITVDGQKHHIFSASSRISKALDTMAPTELATRLSGGDFLFKDNQLVDFRDGHYNGFVHTDDAISALGETVGSTLIASRQRIRGGNASLGGDHSKQELEVDGLGDGGHFTSRLTFTWSPFHRNINTLLQIERLICTNGMIGLTSFFNTSIPMINKWEEHLEIANRQIQNKVADKMLERLHAMRMERASVAEMATIANHATGRLSQMGTQTGDQRQRLLNVLKIADPQLHLGKTYRSNVFQNNALAAQLPAHMTVFDAWNLATEINTHTTSTNDSSSLSMEKLANDLLLVRKNSADFSARHTTPQLSSFSDPENAFFGGSN